jgi:hypothetical protein
LPTERITESILVESRAPDARRLVAATASRSLRHARAAASSSSSSNCATMATSNSPGRSSRRIVRAREATRTGPGALSPGGAAFEGPARSMRHTRASMRSTCAPMRSSVALRFLMSSRTSSIRQSSSGGSFSDMLLLLLRRLLVGAIVIQ